MHNMARPTLGFDTKRDAMIHLHGQGHGLHVIAHSVGSSVESVSTTLCRLGLKANKQSTTHHAGANPPLFLELSPDLLPLLRPHAARRGLTCAALAALIIDTVAADGLVDATLDDRGAA